MDLDLDQLSHAVLHLPIAARAELASRLLESLDAAQTTESAEAIVAAWEAELDRREADFTTDAGFGIPASEVFRRLDADLTTLSANRETPR
ncbi:MAG: addiction module protein [Gemmatimonadaceae bacterium]